MVKIKLVRHGAKKAPFYKVIATDSRYSGDGKALERLGYFNPCARGQEKRISINTEGVDAWVAKGAQVSSRVGKLIKEAAKSA